eukprot:4864175-Alexandrium_andersonii.AAC.2
MSRPRACKCASRPVPAERLPQPTGAVPSGSVAGRDERRARVGRKPGRPAQAVLSARCRRLRGLGCSAG